MKSLYRLMAAGALALSLGACSTIQNSAVGDDAIKATQVAITTYADIYQPAVLTYGNLPLCQPSAPPLCRDPVVHAKLKAVDLAASTAIDAARQVLNANVQDAGQLTAALQAIINAETTIAQAGVVLKR